jgi:hypothetical protein
MWRSAAAYGARSGVELWRGQLAGRWSVVAAGDASPSEGGGHAQISRSPPREAPPYLDLTPAVPSRYSLAAHSGGSETEGRKAKGWLCGQGDVARSAGWVV